MEAGEVLVDYCDGFVAEPGLSVVVVRVCQERRVGVGSVVVGVGEACGEERDGLGYLGVPDDRAGSASAAGGGGAAGVVGDYEDEVVGVLVLVAVLERENFRTV